MTTVVEMEVPIDCPGCENKVKKALKKIKGVHNVEIDIKQQKVTVTGWAKQKKVLKVARSIAGRDISLWPCPYNPESNGYNDKYFKEKYRNKNGKKASSYNYYEHGYHGHEHGYAQQRPYTGIFNENANYVFSEENPHFCSIM